MEETMKIPDSHRFWGGWESTFLKAEAHNLDLLWNGAEKSPHRRPKWQFIRSYPNLENCTFMKEKFQKKISTWGPTTWRVDGVSVPKDC